MLNTTEKGAISNTIYNGDITKLQKFANSFLLQAPLQLTKKYLAHQKKQQVYLQKLYQIHQD